MKVVFDIIDQDKSLTLTKDELEEYLRPFASAMIPTSAGPLRSLLVSKAAEEIYGQMDVDHDASISHQEMSQWAARGNNIIDTIASIIERNVYEISKREEARRQRQRFLRISTDGCIDNVCMAPCMLSFKDPFRDARDFTPR
mmetsp:Transcript_131969/g.294171  ORF Transcript_131969/g.294171 Transcript_131969/m.294171 type:complete len:142 (-) Transcript_131969:32-457(-)